jgi:hypothetical protein
MPSGAASAFEESRAAAKASVGSIFFILFLSGMTKRQANYPPVPCFLHFVAYGKTGEGAIDKMKPSKKPAIMRRRLIKELR